SEHGRVTSSGDRAARVERAVRMQDNGGRHGRIVRGEGDDRVVDPDAGGGVVERGEVHDAVEVPIDVVLEEAHLDVADIDLARVPDCRGHVDVRVDRLELGGAVPTHDANRGDAEVRRQA